MRIHGLSRAFLAVTLVLLASCAEEQAATSAPGFAIEKQYEAENVDVKLRVSAAEITASDRVLVEIEAVAPEGEEINFPQFEDKLGEFQVVDSRRSSPRLVDEGRVLVKQSYELEPFLPGDYSLPALKIEHGSPEARATLETEEVLIKVASVLPEEEAEPDIKEIAPPVELPGTPPWVYGVIALGILALAAGAYFLWKRRRIAEEDAIPPVPPHEQAYEELEALLREDLITKGEVKTFYLRLSNILRHYIEGRFSLRAPERTTEEFLIDLRAGDDFSTDQKVLLRRFLEHCDLVKFAKHDPTRTEIDQSVDACRNFIDETKPLAQPEETPANHS